MIGNSGSVTDPLFFCLLLPPLLLYIKAGTGFVGKFIMTMNRG